MDAADELLCSSGEESEASLSLEHKNVKSASNRFNLRQRAILDSYYRMGMVGTGKVYSFRHERAAADVGCTVNKVKVQNY